MVTDSDRDALEDAIGYFAALGMGEMADCLRRVLAATTHQHVWEASAWSIGDESDWETCTCGERRRR